MWKNGNLGGEIMPEDVNPHFEKIQKKIIYILHYQWL